MARKGVRPAMNSPTHSSFAALYTAGNVPPASPTSRASLTAGNASSSRGSNVHVAAVVQSQPGAAPGTRSGQPRPRAIGIAMLGGEAWASVDPSVNSTIEWTTDWGWTTTVMRSNPMPNSR